jgi:hypothetical protein
MDIINTLVEFYGSIAVMFVVIWSVAYCIVLPCVYCLGFVLFRLDRLVTTMANKMPARAHRKSLSDRKFIAFCMLVCVVCWSAMFLVALFGA